MASIRIAWRSLTQGVVVALAAVAGAQEPPPAPAPTPAQAPLAVSVPSYSNTNCPVMGKPISSKLFTDTEYGRIWICCKGCNKKIAADPEKAYKSAFPRTVKLDNAICPVSGKKIEGEPIVVQLQGHEVRLHSKECVAVARADSQVVLAKAVEPKLMDVANSKCPITGTAVAANVFCVVGDQIVRLSSTDCVEQVKKEPKAALDKALADARAAGKQR